MNNCIKPRTRYFSFSSLDIKDFPKSLRNEVVDNYCGDDAAMQAYNLFELVRTHTHNELIPEPCFVDEGTDFDKEGVYYAYIISTGFTMNRQWIMVKLLLEYDKIRIVFIPARMSHPKYKQMLNSFGCTILSYNRRIVKITVSLYTDRNGEERTSLDDIAPVTEKERQIIYFAAEKFCNSTGGDF